MVYRVTIAAACMVLNICLAGQALGFFTEDWWIVSLVCVLPFTIILFPSFFAETARWGLMASLASDYSRGIPPVVMSTLGWILMGIMTVRFITASLNES